MNDIELQKQESMMNVGTIFYDNLDVTDQHGKSSSPRNDTDVEGAKIRKDYFSSSSIVDSHISKLEKESGQNSCESAKCELQTKIVELEKILIEQTKDYDDVKLKLSNRTVKFEAYFEKLENTKVVLERKLARKTDDSKAEKINF
uniref:Uncharacterized protein n=1 Tax=Tanacetum cinerariifolium TaxID=118510 RepID=A0A699I3V3_TANCI|nr:hypothetical protein [Tanacetum cinerariifolium]